MSRHSYLRADFINAMARAEEDLKQHVLTQETPDRWRFARPGDSTLSFTVCAAPGALLLYGDVGEMLFLRDLKWLRGVMDGELSELSLLYITEKIPYHMRPIAFSKVLAELHLEEERIRYAEELVEADEEDRVDLEEKLQILDKDNIPDSALYGQDLFYEWLSDNFEIDDYPTVMALTWQALFQICCLWYFCRALSDWEKLLPFEGQVKATES